MVEYLDKAMTDHDDAKQKEHEDRWEQNAKRNEEEGLKHREKMKNPCRLHVLVCVVCFVAFEN